MRERREAKDTTMRGEISVDRSSNGTSPNPTMHLSRPPKGRFATRQAVNTLGSPSRWAEFLSSLLDFLYPRRCVGCDEEGVWLCANCQSEIVRVKTPTCLFCQAVSERGKTCLTCRAHHALTGVAVFGYHEGILKDAIHALKYDSLRELADPLGSLLALSLYASFAKKQIEIVAIPLHQARLAQRGFNQCDLLARAVARRLGSIVNSDLVRVRNATPQVDLPGPARRKNMTGVFVWKGKNLQGKTIILIDDVATTGTTLDEAAKVLREAGARQVWGAVVARG